MSTAALLTTPLHDWHKAHGGRLVEFGGWSMPVQYSTIIEEHQAGYRLNDRLLRPAMVTVSKGSPAPKNLANDEGGG